MSVRSTPDPAREGVPRVALVIRGAAWVAASRFLAQFVGLLAGILLAREFGRSLSSDESCLQTLIATSGLPTLDAEVTFTRWPSSGAAHPDALGPEDFDEVTRAGTAFARKVSGAPGAQLCDLLDENVPHSALVPVPRQREVDVLAETW